MLESSFSLRANTGLVDLKLGCECLRYRVRMFEKLQQLFLAAGHQSHRADASSAIACFISVNDGLAGSVASVLAADPLMRVFRVFFMLY